MEALLSERFLVTCGAPDCARDAAGREVVAAGDPHRCHVCGGSANRRAVLRAAQTFARHGVTRVVVVGGSPAVHEELQKLKPPEWSLRLVDGTQRRTGDLAKADLKWAQLVIVWGSSELDHKVSTLYMGQRDPAAGAVITVNRRGIAALLEAAVRHFDGR